MISFKIEIPVEIIGNILEFSELSMYKNFKLVTRSIDKILKMNRLTWGSIYSKFMDYMYVGKSLSGGVIIKSLQDKNVLITDEYGFIDREIKTDEIIANKVVMFYKNDRREVIMENFVNKKIKNMGKINLPQILSDDGNSIIMMDDGEYHIIDVNGNINADKFTYDKKLPIIERDGKLKCGHICGNKFFTCPAWDQINSIRRIEFGINNVGRSICFGDFTTTYREGRYVLFTNYENLKICDLASLKIIFEMKNNHPYHKSFSIASYKPFIAFNVSNEEVVIIDTLFNKINEIKKFKSCVRLNVKAIIEDKIVIEKYTDKIYTEICKIKS